MKKFFKILLIAILLGNTSISLYSDEIREIPTVEEYSKQFLDESFVLEDLKNENEKTTVSEIEITDEEPVLEDDIIISDNSKPDALIKEFPIEKKIENVEIEKEKQDEEKQNVKKANSTNINWEIEDNFRAALIGDLNGNVFYSKNADKLYPLASVTKMMTLMVTFDEINAGRASLKDKVKISNNPIKYGGSGIPLKAGQIFTLEDLIKASAIYSANNATYAIAEHIGKGKISNFIAKMNKKVKSLGLQNDLKYYTPAGLPTRMTKQPMDSGTARAIYKLSIEALKYKKYIEIAGIKNTKIHNGKISIRNRNKLIGKQGVYGIKTGFHKEAKYNIAIASKSSGVDVIVVVLGGESYTTRDKNVLDLLTIFNDNYNFKVIDKKTVVGNLVVPNTNIKVPVNLDKTYQIALKNSQNYDLKLNVRKSLKLNIFKGEKVGTYEIYIDNNLYAKGDLLASKTIE